MFTKGFKGINSEKERDIGQPVCEICGQRRTRYKFTKNGYAVFLCKDCKHVFIFPRPNKQKLVDYYANVHKGNPCYSYDKIYGCELSPSMQAAVSFAIEHLDEDASILDVGCGNGVLLKALKESGFRNIMGLEYSQEILKKKAHPDLNIVVGELDEQNFVPYQFQYITAIYVMEHLVDPIGFLEKIVALVRSGGYFFAEVPNIYGLGGRLRGWRWCNMVPPEHLNFFSKKSIRLYFEKSGNFRICELSTPYPLPGRLAIGSAIGALGFGGHIRIIAEKN